MPIITGMVDSYKIPTNARDLSTAFYMLNILILLFLTQSVFLAHAQIENVNGGMMFFFQSEQQ